MEFNKGEQNQLIKNKITKNIIFILRICNYFKEFSSDHVRNFRHDILYNGICLNWCKDQLEMHNQSYLYEAELDTDHQVKFIF